LGDDESGDLDPIVALASERVTTLLEVVAPPARGTDPARA
jgi:hypothetical protein